MDHIRPERGKREDINYPEFKCKKCKKIWKLYRQSYDRYIKCPDCLEIKDMAEILKETESALIDKSRIALELDNALRQHLSRMDYSMLDMLAVVLSIFSTTVREFGIDLCDIRDILVKKGMDFDQADRIVRSVQNIVNVYLEWNHKVTEMKRNQMFPGEERKNGNA